MKHKGPVMNNAEFLMKLINVITKRRNTLWDGRNTRYDTSDIEGDEYYETITTMVGEDDVVTDLILYEGCKLIEWSGYIRGPGSGPMGSGGDGYKIPTCPVCNQIQVGFDTNMYPKESFGHKKGCWIYKRLKGEAPA